MLPIRSHSEVLYVEGPSIDRDGEGWAFSWSETDVNSMIEHRYVKTTAEVVASGPVGRMTADALDALARAVDCDPASAPWCRERRLLERIVADDLEGVRGLLPDGIPTTVNVCWSEPILTLALGVAAWTVAADLLLRGAPFVPPPGSTWDAASYAIAALDGSDGALVVLELLLARGKLEPAGGYLRLVRAPRIVHALIDAGADPDGLRPSSPTLEPFLNDATPLAAAVVHRDNHGEDRFDVAAALLERGATIEARDKRGRTALIVAAEWGNEGPVRWLLDHGSNVKCKADAKGRTPHSLALARPDDPGSRLLLERLEARR